MKRPLLLIIAFFLIHFVNAQDTNNIVENNCDEIEFDITTIQIFEQRMHFVYSLYMDERFNINICDRDGIFIIDKKDNDDNDTGNLFKEFCIEEASAFNNMSKDETGENFPKWKTELPERFVTSMMFDIYSKDRMNNLCANSEPFCTDNDLYYFEAGVNAGSGEPGPNYNCLSTQPNPAWYYMRIDNPGGMIISMYSTPQKDIDYCCWGPFSDPFEPCPNGLTGDKVVSCSYSTSATEQCTIPNNATTGEYYILVITNYSNTNCIISFNKTGGTGTTDCSILPPLIECNHPCYGGTLTLSAQYVTNAIYSWTGPNGFTSNEREPVIPNVTMEHSGTYSCSITVAQQTSDPMSIDIEILPNTISDFEYAPGCAGNATVFIGKEGTSPEGYDEKITRRVWDFGDGSPTMEGKVVTHVYELPGEYTVTYSVAAQNADGSCEDVSTQQIEIIPQTISDFSFTKTDQAMTFVFTGNEETIPANYNEMINKRVWDFGDGSPTVEGITATHTYSIPGEYSVKYSIAAENSNYSCEDISTKQIIAIEAIVDFNYESACIGNETIFSGVETTIPQGYNHIITNREWHFSDDNSISYGNDAKHIFNEYGEHEVTYIVSSENEFGLFFSDTVTKTINVGTHYTPGGPIEYDSIFEPGIVCENFFWNGQYYSSPGIYRHTYTTTQGCDSIVSLHIDKVYNNFTIGATLTGQEIVEPSPGMIPNYYIYSIEGLTDPEEGDIPSFKWEIYSYYDTPNHVADSTDSGSSWYCQSINEDPTQIFVSVNLEGNALLKCIINSMCGTTYLEKFIYTEGYHEGYSMEENTIDGKIKIFPNPVKDVVFISYNDGIECLPMTISIYNSYGILIDEIKTNSSDIVSYSTKDLPDGIYFIRIAVNDSSIVKKVIFGR
ncbi:MAG: PKD domain-containing protein [Candidatus Limimorpha sp.]